MTAPVVPADTADAALVLGLPEHGLLGLFNRAGVLAPADVHVAVRLGRLGGDPDEVVALAAALAVRAPRVGHVYVDLATVRATAAADVEEEVDIDALPWPAPDGWVDRLASSPLVAPGEDGPADRPLRLVGNALYLDRYWRDECLVAADLLGRATGPAPGFDSEVLAAGLRRLFPADPGGAGEGEQAEAAALAVSRRLSVIAGGPGTGKTTTLSRILALLDEQAEAAGTRPPLVALAAPTGKAAARMEEALRSAVAAGDLAVSPAVGGRLSALGASTLHRLLGRHPGSGSRFRHHRHNRLPHDVVVVDETSMVSLWLMARLLEAVRPDARLVLVGDPEQLASVEAGAVLGDIAGPALGQEPPTPAPVKAGGPPMARAVAVLRANHRFGGALAALSAAVRAGDADGAVEVLSSGDPAVSWLDLDPASAPDSELAPVRDALVGAGSRLVRAARDGDGPGALAALASFRLLCAHRRGPAGVTTWNQRAEEWLAAAVEGFSADGQWYVGRPVVVTVNDYGLRLYNGDTGVVVARPEGGLAAAFPRDAGVAAVSPSRLADVETVHAMTVHKAQGSEFAEVALVLPEPGSRVLTRELLYTAVTRAQQRVVVAGTEEAVRAAVGRPVARASGLTARLWGPAPDR